MNTKIVYSIISGYDDYFLNQLLISIHSLRYYNKNVVVEVVMDKETEATLTGYRAQLREMVSKIFVERVPSEYSKVQRSRYLKTSLRNYINGNYLFLDTDTVVCGSLKNIDKVEYSIAMAADLNGQLELAEPSTIAKCKKAGFGDMAGVAYFNSGVTFAKDNDEAKQFYEDWHRCWIESTSKGCDFDQPAMNFVLSQRPHIVKQLDDLWNCQIYWRGWDSLNVCKIMHYGGMANNETLIHFFNIVNDEGLESQNLNIYIRRPKTKLYAYLTNQENNFIGMIIIYIKIYLTPLYKIIASIHG